MAAWTEEEKAQLRELWARPELSKSAIGRLMKRSKSSIISAGRRLNLPYERNRPIVVAGPETVKRRQHAAANQRSLGRGPTGIVPMALVAVTPARSCQWPMWENGQKATGDFCCGAVMDGKPYCSAHLLMAYVRIAARRAVTENVNDK